MIISALHRPADGVAQKGHRVLVDDALGHLDDEREDAVDGEREDVAAAALAHFVGQRLGPRWLHHHEDLTGAGHRVEADGREQLFDRH